MDALRQMGLRFMFRKQGRVATQSQHRAKLVFQGGITVEILEGTVRTSGGVVRSRTGFRTPFASCVECLQIHSTSQKCVHFKTVGLPCPYGSTGCMFYRWLPENLQTGPPAVQSGLCHGMMSLMSGMQAYWMSNCIHCHPSQPTGCLKTCPGLDDGNGAQQQW